jgi:hypothetical protein
MDHKATQYLTAAVIVCAPFAPLAGGSTISNIYGGIGGEATAAIYDESNFGGSPVFSCTTGVSFMGQSCNSGLLSETASDGLAYSAQASASAALQTGNLSNYVSGSGPAAGEAPIEEITTSMFNDTLSFQGTTADGYGMIGLGAIGSSEGTQASAELKLYVTFLFDDETDSAFAIAGTTTGDGDCGYSLTAGSLVCGANESASTPGVSLTFPVFTGDVEIKGELVVDNSGAGTAGYTDPITLTLPSGVTYTSASGLFLTETAVATPEPATTVPLIAVFTALAAGRLLRRSPFKERRQFE